MTSLYGRLFTYRQRAARSPLEDYLTEALADLLNRMPEQLAREAAHRLLGGRADVRDALAAVWPAGANVSWITQWVIDGGKRPDLVFTVDRRPVLVVENKIAAGFQHHGESDNGQDQLATYAKWIGSGQDPQWGGGIALLTHWTPAPLGFTTDDSSYACNFRNVVRWADLARWLSTKARLADDQSAAWIMLTHELNAFLQEQNMDSDLATTRDFAALQLYVASADRVRNTIERLWEGARSLWLPLCQGANYPLEVSSRYHCVWKYRYLARVDPKKGYLAVGVRFPDGGGYLAELSQDGEPYVFVELSSEASASPVADLELPDPWVSYDGVHLAKRRLHDLPADPDELIAVVQPWINSRIKEAAVLLS